MSRSDANKMPDRVYHDVSRGLMWQHKPWERGAYVRYRTKQRIQAITYQIEALPLPLILNHPGRRRFDTACMGVSDSPERNSYESRHGASQYRLGTSL